MVFKAFDQTVEAGFRRIGNETRDRVVEVVFDGLHDLGDELTTELFAFGVDVLVVTAAEVDALKTAGLSLTGLLDLWHGNRAVALDDERVSRLDFVNVLGAEVEGGLDDRSLTGDDHYLVVFVEKRRTDAVRIPHDERVAVADHAAHDVPAVQ